MEICPKCGKWLPAEDAECDCAAVDETASAQTEIERRVLAEAEAAETAAIEKRMRTGATWMYWIGGLSMVNAILLVLGADLSFIFGLVYPLMTFPFFYGLDIPMPGAGFHPWQLLPLAISLAFIASFVALGWAARRGLATAFIVGMVIYGLDGIGCYLLGSGWLEVGAHGVGLAAIGAGYLALRELGDRQEQPARWSREGWALVPTLLSVLCVGAVMALAMLGGSIEEQLLAKAPASFSEDDRQRLRVAYKAVYQRWDEPDIPMSEVDRINNEIKAVFDLPEAGASEEQMQWLLDVLEDFGQIRSQSGRFGAAAEPGAAGPDPAAETAAEESAAEPQRPLL